LTGCEIVALEVHEDAIANASRMARQAGLDVRARLVRADASETLRFRA